MKRGMVQIYTGSGRGKSAAAIGLAVRAIGHGMSAFFIGFSGEHIGYSGYSTISQLMKYPALNGFKSGGLKGKAKEALVVAKEATRSGEYDVVILDEVTTAIDDEFIDEGKVLEILKKRNKGTEVVLTGRRPTKKIVAMADLVTRMTGTRKHKRR